MVIILRDSFFKNSNTGIWAFVTKSLKLRVFVLVLLSGIVPMLFSRYGILINYEKYAISARISETTQRFHIMADFLNEKGYLANTKQDSVNSELLLLSDIYGGRILVINSELVIVKDTYGMSEGKTIISDEVVRCLKGQESFVHDKTNDYIELAVPIKNGNDTEGVIMSSISTEPVSDAVEDLTRKASLTEAAVGIILFAVAMLLSNNLIRPFEKVTSAISTITDGYGNEVIKVKGYREMDSIVNALNELLKRMKVLDDSRQEFVSNVSHELKTPLTSMKVLADSLISLPDAPVEMYREFMEDITKEIDRENSIITDLLSLVKMDKKEGQLNIKVTDIGELIENVLHRLKPIAAVSEITLVYESERQVEAEVDEVKLSLAISNLAENAIKYNRQGGQVTVRLNADHQFFSIEVSDTGIGIPQDSIEHIFERFYRVDKSHSREIGGTGLGLAITRNAILMHRGSIRVSSAEGDGTSFIVRVPLNFVK